MDETVDPATAALRPTTAAIFPAAISSTEILSGPTIIDRSCTLYLLLDIPDMYSSLPFLSVPLKSRPTAISPAWGSTIIFVTIMLTGPVWSQTDMAFPISEFMSPFHICGILYFCATSGLGRCFITISRIIS